MLMHKMQSEGGEKEHGPLDDGVREMVAEDRGYLETVEENRSISPPRSRTNLSVLEAGTDHANTEVE
jgi:hypothetical protein